MAPIYKLSYFNVRGICESIRFLLAYGGLDYEDNRVSKDDWPALKADTPMGQMPVLEVGAKKYHQHVAIARCIAKKVGLVGKDEWEDLEIDAMVDTINDLRVKVTQYFVEQNEEIKEQLKQAFLNEIFPKYYSKFDQWAGENNGYLVLGKLTWADVYFVALTEGMGVFTQVDIATKYPNVGKVQDNVLSNGNIKKWVEIRPKTET